MANRLAGSTSPYLLQHADNPVDWWPWSDEAFEQARRRDVPVLLSVGYSACHWCHVMAHESFEDPATAGLLNEHMVAIKVDREERPDVDAVYMTATQALTGQGGWPMTVFMTQEREPFYAGTYFPRDYFQQLILGVARAWTRDRASVTGQATEISRALAERAATTARAQRSLANLPLDDLADGEQAAQRLAGVSAAAVDDLAADYDPVRGGFGGAPKFPPSMVLEFLLRHYARTSSEQALRMAGHTMEAMARGGMYDQLGGGFARYSVDDAWVVPHFEKMLYDNALLVRSYTHHWRRTSSPLARRVAEQTCDWMTRELRTAEGGLASALDADSDGEEGRFYTWTPEELAAALGPDDAPFAAEVFAVTRTGTFERGRSVLQLPAGPEPALSGVERFGRVRAALFAARESRVRPARDDKVVAAWNGLAIAALAETGLLLGRPDLVAVAHDAATLLANVHIKAGVKEEPAAPGEPARAGSEPPAPGGPARAGSEPPAPGGPARAGSEPELRLVRTSRDGVAGPSPGLLEDYACVAEGFLALAGVTGEARWAELAGRLLEVALARFGDGAGGFFDTADDAESLIFRPADVADNATPSGTFAAAGALLSYAALTGSGRHRQAAVAGLGPLPAIAERYPRAAGSGLAVVEALLAGPVEIAIAGPPGEARDGLHLTAFRDAPPGTVIALGDGTNGAGVPLLAGRGPVNGSPAAYVCRGFACRAPVTSPAELAAALSVSSGEK
ncbi:MAG TPA: thioredoxin domain-containing protein [Streptosporangiaceae bacterium]|nr:thioredoxin domain-containing protein [Streptosporangiaceae bacterium]